MRWSLRGAAEVYNYVEFGLWPAIGIVVAATALRKQGAARTRGLTAAVTLFAFGASDWAENATGGEWWHPWWLLLWKAACVAVLLVLLIVSRSRRRLNLTPPSP